MMTQAKDGQRVLTPKELNAFSYFLKKLRFEWLRDVMASQDLDTLEHLHYALLKLEDLFGTRAKAKNGA